MILLKQWIKDDGGKFRQEYHNFMDDYEEKINGLGIKALSNEWMTIEEFIYYHHSHADENNEISPTLDELLSDLACMIREGVVKAADSD